MDGLSKRISSLFSNGYFFLSAMDHGQFVGVPKGLENITEFINEIGSLNIHGMILNPGVALKIKDFPSNKKLILRVTHAGSAMSMDIAGTRLFIDPESALRLGADAVIAMGIVGQENDSIALEALSKTIWEYHRFGIPVIAEMLPANPKLNNDTETIANISRIGAELGADVIKTYLTPDFKKVTSSCPVPILVAGGAKTQDFMTVIKESAESGAKGVAIGRNLFQSEEKEVFVENINRIFMETMNES